MDTPKPVPLYPAQDELKIMRLEDYPELSQFLADAEPWKVQSWQLGLDFLMHISQQYSQESFPLYRGQVEKFILWSILVEGRFFKQYRRDEILKYIEFIIKPPSSWISLQSQDRFIAQRNGFFINNPKWAPFRVKRAKFDTSKSLKTNYSPSQASLQATFKSLKAFYEYLVEIEELDGNPVRTAKSRCRHIIRNLHTQKAKRLSVAQWRFVIDVATSLANKDSRYERSLFLVASLKTLFLRISELSARSAWSPTMNHFFKDTDGYWWLTVYGKDKKIRDVTVPDSYFPFLERYRRYRKLSGLPKPDENQPIISKLRGQGSLTSRQLAQLVQEVFYQAYEQMKRTNGHEEAMTFLEASSSWLRHTGAGLEVDRSRDLHHIAQDIGHESIAMIERHYLEKNIRAGGRRVKKRPM